MALFLVCGLLAMEVVAEANDDADFTDEYSLVEEAAVPATKAKAATKATKAKASAGSSNPRISTWQSRELASDDATGQLKASQKAHHAETKKAFAKVAAQQKQALVKRHQINKVTRKEMRKAATTSAENSVGTAISSLTLHVKKMAARAAALAAKSIAKATKFNHNDAAAERKMKMLEKDVVLLLAAKKKAIHEALISKHSYEKKAARYKAAVVAKVKRAETDLNTIKHKLAGFKVAQTRMKITEAEMHKVAQNVVKQTVSLKSKHARAKRLNKQHIAALKKEKAARKKAKKGLKVLVKSYKQKVKVLKNSYKKLLASPEIGAAMAKRIASAKHKMHQHAKALRLQRKNIHHLKRSLKHARKNTKVLKIASSKREMVLHVATKAYRNLSGAVSRLKALAVTEKSVRLKAPKGSITRTATRTKSAIKAAVKATAAKQKIAFRKAIAAAAQKAAASEANTEDTQQMTKVAKKHAEVTPFTQTDFDNEDVDSALLSRASLDKAATKLLHGQ